MASDLIHKQGEYSSEKYIDGSADANALNTPPKDGWDIEECGITLDDIHQLLFTLEQIDVRTQEQTLLSDICPLSFIADSDIWNSFFLRIPKIENGRDYQKERDAVPAPQFYEIQQYSVPRPVFEDIEKQVAKEAMSIVKSPKFWMLKSLRDDYVGENTYPRYSEAVQKWESDKKAYESQQIANQEAFNKEENERYNNAIREITNREQSYLHPSPYDIQKQLIKSFSEMSLPYAVSIAFDISSDSIFIDILYPDREDIMASEFVTGTKTQTEDNFRYVNAILGCAFQVAAVSFNASWAINNVTVIGHTKKIASNLESSDSTLYAVYFDRLTFTRDFAIRRFFLPYDRLTHYLHILEVSKRYIISPLKAGLSHTYGPTPRYKDLSFIVISVRPSEVILDTDKAPIKKLDSRFEEAAKLVVSTQSASTSNLQIKLGMGYAKTSYVLDQLEKAGIVSSQNEGPSRQVLVTDLRELDGILNSLKSN